jgi:hypothetical protein
MAVKQPWNLLKVRDSLMIGMRSICPAYAVIGRLGPTGADPVLSISLGSDYIHLDTFLCMYWYY